MKEWEDKARKALVGRKIVDVRYLTREEIDGLGWSHAALVIRLNDGVYLFSSRDDEGNDAGALFTNIPNLETIPVI